jgi:hypothetical protein
MRGCSGSSSIPPWCTSPSPTPAWPSFIFRYLNTRFQSNQPNNIPVTRAVDPDSLNPDLDTDLDPAFQVNPDSDPGFWYKKIGIRIRDPDPGWTTRIIFPRASKQFFGLKYQHSLLRIRDPGWKKFGSSKMWIFRRDGFVSRESSCLL